MDNGIRTLKDSFESIPIDENFKLIAGPGAGKTTFLVNHIRNVIKNSNNLKNGRKILCITYTNVAVDTIKERLGNYANEVEISTIHSFLFSHILKPYLWVIKDEINPRLLDLKTVKESFPSYSLLPNNKESYIIRGNFSLSTIYSQLKKFYWKLEDNIIKPQCEIPIYFSDEFLMQYKNNLWNKGKITPDDILLFSYKILIKKPKILDILRIKFPYIFIDEFQDVCNIQKSIIEMIGLKNTIIGIIGDPAQTIYSFRGANYGNMETIKLNLNEYILQINRRSNDKIVNILNNIRNDELIQIPLKKAEILPTILIGDDIKAFEYANDKIGDEKLSVLSYKNEHLNELQLKIESANVEFNEKFLIELKNKNDKRKLLIIHTITAIENFKELDIKSALKNITFAYRNIESVESKLIMKLFQFTQEYNNFKEISLKDFYNNYIYPDYPKKLSEIKRGKIETIYSNIYYSDIIREIKHSQNSPFRTIHSCKGAEFDNVLILNNRNNLNYIFNFNIKNNTHRVYYVALSRAKNNLFISIKNLSKRKYLKLKELGFNVKYLTD